MTTSQTRPVTRRTVLRGAAGAATAGVLTGAAGTAAAQSQSGPDYGGWFDNVSNFDGTVDKTGQKTVTITVGAAGNGGNFAFAPAAVRVDPGTKIVWKWTGKGSPHNVVDEAGAFESDLLSEAGATFSYTVESEGIIKYACVPHKAMGMKGAVVVGNPDSGGSAATTTADSTAEATGQTTEQQVAAEYGDWFSNVSNFDGTVDKTGQRRVTISVGAAGNGGNFAFSPAAVRVDPGTTVVWEWTGKGSSHNVAAADGSFESKLTGESGFTFEHTFESRGVHKYACVPHKAMGMKGAVVVGGSGGSASGSGSDLRDLLTLAGGIGLAGALLGVFAFGARDAATDAGRRRD
ncbi:halocyanin domain-containing protein [Halobaculum sp. P14]|uniref:halocyanin domain-containing protein n=1 Tax=Halobaculum sp. P14 TaxID=3421638 RepID=UPI003EB7C093